MKITSVQSYLQTNWTLIEVYKCGKHLFRVQQSLKANQTKHKREKS